MAFKEMLKLRQHSNMSQADMAMYLGVKAKGFLTQMRLRSTK
jgi:hypothetical protein